MNTLSDSTKSEIVRRFCRVLGEDDVSVTDDFFLDLGGTSLKALQFLLDLEVDLGLRIPLGAFIERPTLEHLFEIAASSTKPGSSSLIPLQSNGDKTPFFFIHAGRGYVLFAQQLAKAIGTDQPMYGLQSPGLDGQEEPLNSIPDLAARYIEDMKSVQPQGPYRVGGFCMGGLLALEVACQLQETGNKVSHLVVISTDAHWRCIEGLKDQIAFHLREVGHVGFIDGVRYVFSRVRFRLYRVYSSLVYTLHSLYERRGKPLPVRFRPVYVAELNYRASWNFQPRIFDGRVFYFRGSEDQHRDPLPFWQRLASRGVEIITVPGREGNLFDAPYVETLGSAVRDCLSCPENRRPQALRVRQPAAVVDDAAHLLSS